MPANDPRVGETWELRLEDRTAGVVFSVSPTVITLISRMRRRISVPLRSFNLMWDFMHPAPTEKCRHLGCSEPAVGRIQQQNFWTWICAAHLPAGVPLALPADRVIDQELLNLERCPACNAPTRILGSRTVRFDGLTLNICGHCRREWALILGPDQPGSVLVEQIDKLVRRMYKVTHAQAGYAVRQRLRDSHLLTTQITAGVAVLVTKDGLTIEPTDLYGNDSILLQGPAPPVIEAAPPDQPSPKSIERLPLDGYKVQPVPGQVWSLLANPKETIEVLEVDREVGMIRFDSVTEQSWGRLTDFLDRYGLFEPGCPCQVGEEWWDPNHDLVIVKEVLFEQAEVILEHVDPPSLPGFVYKESFARFLLGGYQKMVRRSAYQRLMMMGDEDDAF